MADGCCDAKGEELVALRDRQGTVLRVVLAVNAALFVLEFTVGWRARSTALLGDSLDMLGDALVYAFSLWVLNRGRRWRARAALSKGLIQAAFGLFVLGQAIWKITNGVHVDATAMGLMGAVALAGNAWCFSLLWRHKSDDINMRSTWLCSRNDLIANVAVIAAAVLAWQLNSGWPDVVVGVAIAALFLRTAFEVVREALAELGDPKDEQEPAPVCVAACCAGSAG